jgi:alpha-D-xyloside xylohydrolase
LSMSGFPYFASDTGGYRHSPPDRETWLRWVEHSALMPVMQTGDSSSQPPWVYTPENGRDAQALDTYRDFARLHLRLLPFFWSHVKSMAQTGRPVVRPFGLQFPSLAVHPEDQYALGDELMVAPVEEKGATSRKVIRPPGRWFSWWDGAELLEETVAAPLTSLPLFLREGALVPMLRPGVDTLSPATDPGVDSFAADAGPLWVRVQPGAVPSLFTVFDGTVVSQAGTQLTATAGTRFVTSVIWELRGVSRPVSVTHQGAVTEVTSLDAVPSGFTFSGGVLLIKTPLDGHVTTF